MCLPMPPSWLEALIQSVVGNLKKELLSPSRWQIQCWKVTRQWALKQNYAFVFYFETWGKWKVRGHDRTYTILRRDGHGFALVALRGLKIIRGWAFVPRYKNDLGKHVSFRYFGWKQP